MNNSQVEFVDWNLPGEQCIASYNNFHTHLTMNWSVGLGDSFGTGFLSGFEIAGLGSYVLWLNEHFKDHTYPLRKGSEDTPGALNSAFWTAASSNDASLNDASQPGFLSTPQGADTCAWLGYILSQYCDAYGFDIDLDNDTNTLDFVHAVENIFYGVYMAAGQFLGVPVRSTVSGKSINVTFANNSGRAVNVFWIDGQGHEKLYHTLPSNARYTQQTFVGHIWNVRDAASGRLLINYTAVDSSGPVVVQGTSAPISIQNNTGQPIHIFWVDDQNQEQPYGTLADGASLTNSAFLGRMWVVRDEQAGVWKRITQVGPLTVYVP